MVELRDPGFFAGVGDDGQDAEHVEVTALVVCGRERAQLSTDELSKGQTRVQGTYVEIRVNLLLDIRRDVLSGEKEIQLVVRCERHDVLVEDAGV